MALCNLFLCACNYGAKQAPHSTQEQPPLAVPQPPSAVTELLPGAGQLGPHQECQHVVETATDLTPTGHGDVIHSSHAAPKAHTCTEVWCTKHLQILKDTTAKNLLMMLVGL